jgi:hypothetical protein
MEMENDLQNQIDQLKRDLTELNNEIYKTNFSAQQDFPKYSNFTSHLKIPHYDTRPTKCDVGELIENGGKLYLCSATDTWTEK